MLSCFSFVENVSVESYLQCLSLPRDFWILQINGYLFFSSLDASVVFCFPYPSPCYNLLSQLITICNKVSHRWLYVLCLYTVCVYHTCAHATSASRSLGIPSTAERLVSSASVAASHSVSPFSSLRSFLDNFRLFSSSSLLSVTYTHIKKGYIHV